MYAYRMEKKQDYAHVTTTPRIGDELAEATKKKHRLVRLVLLVRVVALGRLEPGHELLGRLSHLFARRNVNVLFAGL